MLIIQIKVYNKQHIYYYNNSQLLNNTIINKTKFHHTQAWITFRKYLFCILSVDTVNDS